MSREQNTMKSVYLLTSISLVSILSACIETPAPVSNGNETIISESTNTSIDGKWVETIGTITESAQLPDGVYAYTLQYNVVGGQAFNMEGDLIQGPLPQHIFNVPGKAIAGQKVRLRYMTDEPIFYELLEKIRFESE